ncbi:MAG: RAMP superfamily CRISPR-associated protein, partial [Acidobacteriota bacterium]
MKSQCFSLRLVTPAFVAGAASGRAQTDLPTKGEKPWEYTIRPEGDSIRVASLRGILRFWFRAAALEWDETRLFERESRVFGSTEHGQGLRLQAIGGDPWQGETITAKPGSAKAYLGYGPIGATRKGEDFSSKNRFVFRQAVPAATTLHFRAFGRP